MNTNYLDTFNIVVTALLQDEGIQETIQRLKMKISDAEEPFVWKSIDPSPYRQQLPPDIKSIWIFVLKKDTASIAHYHPNSTQYTVMIEGKGKAMIGDRYETLRVCWNEDTSNWLEIDANTPHEFYPEEQDMVVISFHTSLSEELIEIKCDSGEVRGYEEK